MNPSQCECHKSPCTCATGKCNQHSFTDSAKIETIDEDGQIHYVESIYQKISLKLFENMVCCVGQNPTAPPIPSSIEPPDTDSIESRGDSNLIAIIKPEVPDEPTNCTGCCEQIYSTSLPDEPHDCKTECNITAELYCQIKKVNSKPGETYSQCSKSTSSSDDSDESDDDDDESSDHKSAEDGQDEDNENNPDTPPDDGASDRMQCLDKNCCLLEDPAHKCKHKLQQHENEENNGNSPNETKWTTMQQESVQHKGTKKQPMQKEKTDYGKEEIPEKKACNNNAGVFEQSDDASALLEHQFRPKKHNKEHKNDPDNSSEWQTITPENKKVKQESLPEETLKEETPTLAQRKRKFGSMANEPTTATSRVQRNSSIHEDFYDRDTRSIFGARKKRVTLSNFVTVEQLKDEKDNLSETDERKSLLRPADSDVFLLLKKSQSNEKKLSWNTYMPFERSDECLFMPDDNITNKKKKEENLPKPTNTSKRNPRQSFIRPNVTPLKHKKFLCFKYLPTISPQLSTTSSLQQNVLEQIAIDPPDSYLPETHVPHTKTLSSRIPVPHHKYKSYKAKRIGSTDSFIRHLNAPSNRKQTLGLDELRNVMEQKNPNFRRSIIPPEHRKSFVRKNSLIQKTVTAGDLALAAFIAGKPVENKEELISSMHRKKSMKAKQVVLVDESNENDEGSDTSLRNKMKKYYPEDAKPIPLAASTPIKQVKKVWQQEEEARKAEKPKETKKKEKVPLAAAAPKKKPMTKDNNEMQKTCCSQTGIHVCVKEAIVTEKGFKEESNIIQMVNIDVTPKNSKLVKVNVMPTVPEINKEGIITIPVQFKISNDVSKEEIPEEPVKMYTPKTETTKNEFIYQENPENNWHEHYMDQYIMEERDNMQEEPYVNLLWAKMTSTLTETNKEEKQNAEIQTDLALGQKLLSKSLSSLKSNESAPSVQNKSEPVKKTGIDWNDIELPPPGTFVIQKMPPRKPKRRFSSDSNKSKDNNNHTIPSTSGRLPPTEEIKTKKEFISEPTCPNFLNCIASLKQQREEPYIPANGSPEAEPKCTRSKIISLVFSESFYNNTDSKVALMQQTVATEKKTISPCTSKPEIPWNNIILPTSPQIKKVEKADTSRTSTSITDQTFTDENMSMSPTPKTTDTSPNLTENSTHSGGIKLLNDIGTNTSVEKVLAQAGKSNATSNNIPSFSVNILKSFKEDPVLSAFKAFEEELKPVRRVLAEVQSKLRALNIPELECIFKKDQIAEYALSRSSSQIAQSWEYKRPASPIFGKGSSNVRSPPHFFGKGPSELLDKPRRSPYEDFRVSRFATPFVPDHSRDLPTDIWKSFGSCERNTIKCPYEKYWNYSNLRNMRNADSYNSSQYSPPRHESSRNSTPESDFSYMPPKLQRKCTCFHCMLDKRVEMVNDDDENPEYYPSSYKSMPIHHPHHPYAQQDCCYDSEASLFSNGMDRSNSNHVLTGFPPDYSPSFHILAEDSKKYMPCIKVRPVTHYYMPDNEAHDDFQNLRHISTRNTSINLKNGKVYARTKIELPRTSYKRVNNKQKSVKKIYPQPNERNITQSDYDGCNYNRQPYEYTCPYSSLDDNLPIFSNCYKEYSNNERYA